MTLPASTHPLAPTDDAAQPVTAASSLPVAATSAATAAMAEFFGDAMDELDLLTNGGKPTADIAVASPSSELVFKSEIGNRKGFTAYRPRRS